MVHTITIFILLLHQFFGFIIPAVYAGVLSSSKITISDSRTSHTGTDHSFDFTTATTDTIATVTFEYCTTSSGTCTTPSGLSTTGASQGSPTGIGAGTSNFSTNGTIIYTVTTPVSVPSSTAITIPYSGITNPSTADTSFFVKITTKNGSSVTIDNTVVAFATLTSSSLTITADVGSTFDVDVAPVTTGTINGATINITDTTASSVPFGTLSSGSTKIAAHDVTVTTNATNGYVVTVKSSDPPLADDTNNIDKFTGTNASPTTWSSPSGTSPNINSGFIGYTTQDTSLCTGTADRFGTNEWAGAETTPYELICNSGPVMTGETTRIGWQAEVNGLQPPGSYSGVFILVVTPTY